MKINRNVICTSIVMCALAAPLAANAGIKATDRSVRVDLSDVNLQAEEGQMTAYTKLRHAARDVCGHGNLHELGSVQRVMDARQCFDDALQRAIDRVDHEMLTRIHQES